jgi:NADPH-dependent glutamate synthase beta subunit-like oxidoreductase
LYTLFPTSKQIKISFMSIADITKAVDLTGHASGTGPKRFQRPVYMDFMPPCNSACPAGENIQAWLSLAQAGHYEEAFLQIMEDNPFPATMGRICVRSCETGCNRNHIDTTVSIHAVERFLGDKAIEEKWKVQINATPTGKKILVIGGGASGLSCAYHLKRMGHQVDIMEASDTLGGLMQYGVPSYRLPRDIINAEVKRIIDMGIRVVLNYRVKDILAEKQNGKYDAVYIAVGAQRIREEPITMDTKIPVTDAFQFLQNMENVSSYRGQKIIVYGGGKLAMYLSRIVRRLGGEAIVLFPGDRKLMPAYDYEADDAIEEGVNIQFLRSIHSIRGRTFSLEKMKVEKNKAVGTGEEESIEGDMLVLALTQRSETEFLRQVKDLQLNEDGLITVGNDRMTGVQGIFAGGDMLPGEQRSATIAIGQGKKAARYINGYVMGQPFVKPDKHPTAGYRKLHMWYKTEAPKKEQEKLAPEVAVRNFHEILSGLSEKEARYEAQRCLSCGNCFECDGCYGACPEEAIIKLGPGNRYRFDLDKCTGCAVCFEQCPCHAIEMIPEPVKSSSHAG